MRLILNEEDLKELRDEEAQKEIDEIDEVTGFQKERFKKPNNLKEMKDKYMK